MAYIDYFLRQEAVIKPFIREANGDLYYGDEETRKCRIETGANLSIGKSSSGVVEQVTASAMMFTTGDPIPERSLVTFGGETLTVIRCRIMHGFHDSHLEVYLE